jgi:ComF family protein
MPLDALLNALAPPLCGASAGAAEPLCTACRRELSWLPPDPVPVPLPVPVPVPVEQRLPDAPAFLAWAPLAYEGGARGVVRALKFKGARRAAGAMAAQIAANAPPGWLAPPAVLVPVPLHPARARKRGYNQAELLARALATRTSLEVDDRLERAGPRGTQVGRDRAQRLGGIAGTVALASERAPPRHAILVDDVMTTGATLAACAAVLRRHGAVEVVAVAYARTPGR